MTGVTVRVDDGVATITFGDPAKRNALDQVVAGELRNAIETVGDDVGCIVVQSGGTTFCAGADLQQLETLGSEDRAEDVRQLVYGSFQALVSAIELSPAPVVARVHGPALGLGADVALACDLRVASTEAWLQESWIRLGTISALGGAEALAATLGVGDALDLLLTARRLDATTARARGVFQRVVAPEDLDREVATLAHTIAGFDGRAVRAMKSLVRGSARHDALSSALDRGLEMQVPLIARPEFSERVRRVQNAPRPEPRSDPAATVGGGREPSEPAGHASASARALGFAALPHDRTKRFENFGRWETTHFPTLLGVQVEEIREGYCRMRVPWRDELTQLAGIVHGGAIATLIDTVTVPAAGVLYDDDARLVTVDLHVQYHGGVRQEAMVAEGWVTHSGRSVVFCEAEVRTGSGDIVAKGMSTFKVSAPRAPAP